MRRAYIAAAERLCATLDRIPSYEEGHWYWASGYGCRIGIARHAAEMDERWGTGVWQPVESD